MPNWPTRGIAMLADLKLLHDLDEAELEKLRKAIAAGFEAASNWEEDDPSEKIFPDLPEDDKNA